MAGVPYLLLPGVASRHDVGVYGAADRLTSVAVLIVVAVNSIYAPRFAAANHNGQGKVLRRLLAASQAYGTASYVPLLGLFVVGGQWTLRLFGGDFAAGTQVLTILAFAQLVNAGTGGVAYFNYMTGGEGFEVWWSIAALALLLAGSAVMGESYGALGVATAVAVVTSVKNGGSYWRARIRIRALSESCNG
jgi:O-antigen/teichoic acid export membrane protein